MTKKQLDDEELCAFLRTNKPRPEAGTRNLEERILMATVLRPTILQTIFNLIRKRFMVFAIPSTIIVAALLLFSLQPRPRVEDSTQQQPLVALSEQEQHEIADFMEGTWRQSIGDSEFDGLMEETSL